MKDDNSDISLINKVDLIKLTTLQIIGNEEDRLYPYEYEREREREIKERYRKGLLF